MMDLRQLRYFLRIVETGSFSKAAEALRIAQPSLSQHVRALEDELGVELLRRSSRGVMPTEAGLILRDHAHLILGEVDRAKKRIRETADTQGGEVTVGLSSANCRALSVPLMQAVAAAHPRIVVHLVEAMSGSLLEWVQSGRLDVAMCYDVKPTDQIVVTDVMVEELRLIVAADHAFARRASVTLAEVADLALVLPGVPHTVRSAVARCFAAAQLEPTIEMTCDSITAILELVAHGRVTILPVFGLMEDLEGRPIAAVPIVDPTPCWRLSVLTSRKSPNPGAAGAVADELRRVSVALVADGVWEATPL